MGIIMTEQELKDTYPNTYNAGFLKLANGSLRFNEDRFIESLSYLEFRDYEDNYYYSNERGSLRIDDVEQYLTGKQNVKSAAN